MLWILASLFFVWCAYREILYSIVAKPGYDHPTPASKSYLAVVLTIAAALAWTPVHLWHFERFLSLRATELADNHRASVHCNSIFDTMVDAEMLAAGHADPRTGKIGIQHPWCNTLMSYLRHPDRANEQELWSLGLFTHESMHIRGEMNEARTECQAVQRNYRAAKLLGVPDPIAKQNALDYYNNSYRHRGAMGIMQAAYYSDQCAPGKSMDEHLIDSTWAP
ncbi:MAG TPA: hypothetical protein VHY75_14970 [Steroidobacteraceae bacterium]|jgi:hypothetical protein|nr:hypothetical protein [Steroidobacteraceae bacterium]